MERTAPLNNAQKIKKPLLIIQGQNDPRVPAGDAAKLVAATKDRIPVWYILAKDEGHGFMQTSQPRLSIVREHPLRQRVLIQIIRTRKISRSV